jgi:hypothetical protein
MLKSYFRINPKSAPLRGTALVHLGGTVRLHLGRI